ncbi:pyrroline-5-carboxylate reductase family protein [Sphingobium lignivorans]|uniref:Pyrroline-5-carboxylate reductase n=1 Tax=Sphingobium lignivorans TaxID=2735886 RepID=A0ABR6NBT7_9SPHN|nr:pyrroline-5-carboxylate reductase [Sphingobium lignivorans]MBB5984736.1 pyrroline-5-carboxylate reductase [Sphingobium lignivorans]
MAKPDADAGWPARLLLIGCGNMAGAMLARWLELGLPAERVTVVRPSGRPVAPGVTVVTQVEGPLEPGTVVMLAFKPQQLGAVAPGLTGLIGPETVLLSILAGVPAARLRSAFPQAGAILRCMPNLPVRIGKGVSTLYGEPGMPDGVWAQADALCRALGLVEWLEDEALFDTATALAGCGPAFVYRFIDALSTAGAELGLAPDMAARMALATMEGAALSAASSDVAPAAMADAVASKGGMTREGLNVLDEEDGLAPLIARTVRAARDRGAALAAASQQAD